MTITEEPETETISETEIIAQRLDLERVDIEGADVKDDDDRFVCRFTRRHFQLESEITRLKDQHAAMLKRLESDLKRLEYCCGGLCADIVRRKLEGKKRKSIITDWGTVGFRTTAPALVVEDEAELIIACTLADGPLKDCVDTKIVLRKAELNDFYKATGEIPQGCKVTEATEKFFVR